MKIENNMQRDYVSSLEKLTVLHLDHSIEKGGAELALYRLASNNDLWFPIITTPENHSKNKSIFSGLKHYFPMGPMQPSGILNASKIKIVKSILNIFVISFRIRFSNLAKNAQIFHANTTRAALYTTLAAMFSSKVVVVHIRDVINQKTLGKLGADLLQRFVLPRAQGVIASSKFCLNQVEPFLQTSTNTTVIPSPIGIQLRENVNVRKKVTKIGMLARISPWKGQLLLIQAFEKAITDKSVQLVFAGESLFEDKEYEKILQSFLVERDISRRVEFRGHIEDIDAFLDEIDIAVHCSTSPEPLGQNVLQYLAAGKPTIVSDEGGPAEWVQNMKNGLRFKPNDVNDLANKLEMLYTNHNLRKYLAERAIETENLLPDDAIRKLHSNFFYKVLEASS